MEWQFSWFNIGNWKYCCLIIFISPLKVKVLMCLGIKQANVTLGGVE